MKPVPDSGHEGMGRPAPVPFPELAAGPTGTGPGGPPPPSVGPGSHAHGPSGTRAGTRAGTSARSATSSTRSYHEQLDDLTEGMRTDTSLARLVDRLGPSAAKTGLEVFARSILLQLVAFGVVITLASMLALVVLPKDPSSHGPVNFFFYLVYLCTGVYFSRFESRRSLPAALVIAMWPVLLYSVNASGFRPTPYFIASVFFVGGIATLINDRFISRAGEQAILIKKLQDELRSGAGRKAPPGVNVDQDAFSARIKDAQDANKQMRVRFSELFMQLRQMSTKLMERDIFSSIYRVLGRGLQVHSAEIFFLTDDGTQLFVAGAFERDGENILETRPDVVLPNDGRNLLSFCLKERKRALTNDEIAADPTLKGLADRSTPKTVFCAPLVHEDGIRGLVNVSHTEHPKLDDLERQIFQAVVSIAGMAFSNANTFLLTREQLTSTMKQAQSAQKQLRDKEAIHVREKIDWVRKRKALERFMDKNVAAEVLKNPDRTLSNRIPITVLLADLRGFTSLSERLPPNETVGILNEYFTALTPVIFEYGGTLDKYIGDEIMALFGPPKPDIAKNAQRAILCALKMRKAFHGLQKIWKEQRGLDIEMGIALNTGEAIVGFVGSENLTNYTAIGDTVNTAARLEGITGPGRIMVTKATYDFVGKFCEAKFIGSQPFKGKSKAIDVFEILALKREVAERMAAKASGHRRASSGSIPRSAAPPPPSAPPSGANRTRTITPDERPLSEAKHTRVAPSMAVDPPPLAVPSGAPGTRMTRCTVCGAPINDPAAGSCPVCGTPF